MGPIKLSSRLESVASFVRSGDRLADIGTDHAYLPSFLVESGKVPYAIAGDIVDGPVASARQTIQDLNLENQIDLRQGDGLAVIQDGDNMSTITITGMGGDLIRQILEAGFSSQDLSSVTRLILQPNLASHHIRRWLITNHFQIVDEIIVEDNQKFYEIIVADKVESAEGLSEIEYRYGPLLIQEKAPLSLEKWQDDLRKYQNILKQMKQSTNIEAERLADMKLRIDELEELLNE